MKTWNQPEFELCLISKEVDCLKVSTEDKGIGKSGVIINLGDLDFRPE